MEHTTVTTTHAAEAKSAEERRLRADVIRARYRRPRKVRLREYRRMRLANALANAPEGADPHSVNRWTR